MPNPPCSDCKTTLVKHCDSPGCHWLKCPDGECDWGIYDLENGARCGPGGRVERLGNSEPKDC